MRKRGDDSNAADLSNQWFYRHLQKLEWYTVHAVVLPIVALYAFGGMPCVLWGFFARVVLCWHLTFAVNSVGHTWGYKAWNTADNSTNNWLLAILGFGDGW